MTNNSRYSAVILIAGVIVIGLSLVLFVGANGHTNGSLVAAFGLLTALAVSLLAVVVWALSRSVEGSVTVEARLREKAAKRKSDLAPAAAGIISDTAGELRTSVEVIQEELEEILDDEAPPDKEQMQSLFEETDRLRKIIDGMEQLSKAQALARSLKKESVPVDGLLAGIVEATRSAVENPDVAFTVECEPGMVVNGDPEGLGLMIGNIVNNAARSIKGSGTVAIAASRTGAETIFTVSDTGTGIKRNHVDHIFERFFRGTGSGVGMGLAVVKELVDACGGKIQVQTQVGKGTTFTVKLPG